MIPSCVSVQVGYVDWNEVGEGELAIVPWGRDWFSSGDSIVLWVEGNIAPATDPCRPWARPFHPSPIVAAVSNKYLEAIAPISPCAEHRQTSGALILSTDRGCPGGVCTPSTHSSFR